MGEQVQNELLMIMKTHEMDTLQHSLRVLNHIEVMDVLEQNKFKVMDSIKKRSELDNLIINSSKNGLLPQEIFEGLREKAFNPELHASDGFYLSFTHTASNMTYEKFEELIIQFEKSHKEDDDNEIDAEIQLLSFYNQKATCLIARRQARFYYDKESMFSTRYVDEHKLLVEINFLKQIVYFQTSNLVKFRAIKTVAQNFLRNIFGIEKLKLFPPKMSQQLNFTFSETENVAKVHTNVNTNTIKLLDLLLELNNHTSKFSEFECVEIAFDHEDSNKKNIKSKINTQAYGGGDLLGKEDVKELILKGRIILEVEFKIVYNEQLANSQIRKHIIMAGIINDKKEFLRIYMHNNDLTLKQVIKKAYGDLKNVFIEHFFAKSLRNEERILELLGI